MLRKEILAEGVTLYLGDSGEVIDEIGKFDSVICDPPYAEVERDYGKLSEDGWRDLVYPLVAKIKEMLPLSGSAVFVLQPNSERLGKMRPWFFEFQVYCIKTWNIVQDVYWWNYTAPPTAHSQEKYSLLRPSVKHCVWLGDPSCFRDHLSVLLTPADILRSQKLGERTVHRPSGHSFRLHKMASKMLARGGSTPFNLVPIANGSTRTSGGDFGHSAATPRDLCDWWVSYITKKEQTVLDPFMGSGTIGQSAISLGRKYIGIEKNEKYFELACKRIKSCLSEPSFFKRRPRMLGVV